ncbi:hypothetical protein [Serratia marcescens]|uniref:hypothetical protein n=1 Tax=Serratia marcescens TaxID=615 RepID=UPI00148E5859|nr:hypothetical protein [Serratia marcescens]QJU42293.1 hypothetical protein HMI62_24590 [Serratia marcescens]
MSSSFSVQHSINSNTSSLAQQGNPDDQCEKVGGFKKNLNRVSQSSVQMTSLKRKVNTKKSKSSNNALSYAISLNKFYQKEKKALSSEELNDIPKKDRGSSEHLDMIVKSQVDAGNELFGLKDLRMAFEPGNTVYFIDDRPALPPRNNFK